MLFGQTFQIHDLAIIALLIVLEGVLSIDNALVLGLLARRLPKSQQKKALTYGLIGAFVFRLVAIAAATFLLKWSIFKLLGGGYLVWISLKHFVFERGHHHGHEEHHLAVDDAGLPIAVDENPARAAAIAKGVAKFWPTVFVIEMTDIAFAVDSIVAALGVVGSAPQGAERHPKMWVVILGGFLGVVVMRFAAVLFIKLLERFPRFETAAYLLVIVIGLKLVIDWTFNTEGHPHRVNFHDVKAPEFWAFWVVMFACFVVGFIPKHPRASETPVVQDALKG